MKLSPLKLLLDAFIIFNTDRFKNNPKLASRFSKLTLDNTSITEINSSDKDNCLAKISSTELNIYSVGSDQKYKKSDVTFKNIHNLTQEYTSISEALELKQSGCFHIKNAETLENVMLSVVSSHPTLVPETKKNISDAFLIDIKDSDMIFNYDESTPSVTINNETINGVIPIRVFEHPQTVSMPLMTGDNTPSDFKITSYDNQSSPDLYPSWRLFDGVTLGENQNDKRGLFSSKTDISINGFDWVKIESRLPLKITGYTIWNRNDKTGAADRSPKDWILQGSNDGDSWLNIHEVKNSVDTGVGAQRRYDLSGATVFRFYRFYFTGINSSGEKKLVIQEIRFIN